MTIKPFDILNSDSPLPDELTDILTANGIPTKPLPSKDNGKDRIATAREIFNRFGAGLDNIASTIGDIMGRGETDAGRLKAAELALKVQGILNEIDDNKRIPDITINIQGSDNSKTLINLVVPNRI